MPASESVHASLGSMDFVQLVLLFAALFAYVLTLSEAFPARVRGGAATAAFIAATGFVAATPTHAAAVVLLALAISGVAAFAAAAWLLAALLRVDTVRTPLARVSGTEKNVLRELQARLRTRRAGIRSS